MKNKKDVSKVRFTANEKSQIIDVAENIFRQYCVVTLPPTDIELVAKNFQILVKRVAEAYRGI